MKTRVGRPSHRLAVLAGLLGRSREVRRHRLCGVVRWNGDHEAELARLEYRACHRLACEAPRPETARGARARIADALRAADPEDLHFLGRAICALARFQDWPARRESELAAIERRIAGEIHAPDVDAPL